MPGIHGAPSATRTEQVGAGTTAAISVRFATVTAGVVVVVVVVGRTVVGVVGRGGAVVVVAGAPMAVVVGATVVAVVAVVVEVLEVDVVVLSSVVVVGATVDVVLVVGSVVVVASDVVGASDVVESGGGSVAARAITGSRLVMPRSRAAPTAIERAAEGLCSPITGRMLAGRAEAAATAGGGRRSTGREHR